MGATERAKMSEAGCRAGLVALVGMQEVATPSAPHPLSPQAHEGAEGAGGGANHAAAL